MFGGGSGNILDMIIRYRNNINLLRESRYFKRHKSIGEIRIEYLKATKRYLSSETATKEQLQAIRQSIIRERKMENAKNLLVIFFISSAGLFLLIKMFTMFYEEDKKLATNLAIQKEKGQAEAKQNKLDKFTFLVSDGDKWSGQSSRNNAIFQYKKALEIFPNNFDVELRLAKAYIYMA